MNHHRHHPSSHQFQEKKKKNDDDDDYWKRELHTKKNNESDDATSSHVSDNSEVSESALKRTPRIEDDYGDDQEYGPCPHEFDVGIWNAGTCKYVSKFI